MSKPDDWSAETRRTLRFWGVAEGVHGGLLAAAVLGFLPWKTVWINLALVAYAGLHLAAGVGLFLRKRWGWRLGIIAGLLGLVALVIVASGLLASWAYLHGIYGDFGLGASVGALIFTSLALQVLGLVPGLLLRALLREAVRRDLGGGRGIIRTALGLLVVPFALALVVHLRYAMPDVEPVSAAGRAEAIAHLRAALKGEPRPPMPTLAGVPVGAGPVWVTLYRGGEPAARVQGDGPDLAAAIAQAADALAGHPKNHGRRVLDGRLKVDRVTGIVPVPTDHPLLVALSVNPGVEGLRRHDGETERLLLPDDLLKRQAFGVAPLVPGIQEMRFGLDAGSVLNRLGLRHAGLERVRTEGFVEWEGQGLPTWRGNTPAPGEGKAAWRTAAVEGGDFILRQIMEDGRFHYQYYPLTDGHPGWNPNTYSLPRHAGTVYALALLHGATGEARFKDGAERAIAWLNGRMPASCGGPERTCVVLGGKADLGSAALTMVGMLEYQRRTGDARYAPTLRRLGAFVIGLQRPDGDFHHVFDVRQNAPIPAERKMFYSEEAALALVMAHEVLGDDQWLEAARRALDFLTGPKYEGYFLGRFIYGADHWTCIAAEEAWPRLKSPQYLDFCQGYARFIERMQYHPGHWDNVDFEGHYGFSALLIPQAPAAAGFTEAIVSTWELSKHHGREDPRLERQMALSLDALSREQVRAENAWLMPDPAAARGGIRRSLVEQEVRIDFTQHAVAALIRGALAAGG
ncbi:MAG: hypothetical protein H6706_06045 [Myxococcales bacterium]|nr:hypothetical protein [Myxococcales bacterium]